MGSPPVWFFFMLASVSPAFFNSSFCAVWSSCCFAPSCVFVRGGGVRSPGEFGVLVHPSLGLSVKFVCVYSVNGGSALHSAEFTSPKT